jgi:hemoglobin-like flavoprotein
MNLDLHALESSFDLVAPRGEQLMDEFYARLFDAAPAVIPLFANTDMRRQKTCCSGRSYCCANRCETWTR